MAPAPIAIDAAVWRQPRQTDFLDSLVEPPVSFVPVPQRPSTRRGEDRISTSSPEDAGSDLFDWELGDRYRANLVIFRRLHEHLPVVIDDSLSGKDLIDWPVSGDSTIARAHQHATNVTCLKRDSSNYKNLLDEPLNHAIGRSRCGLTTKSHRLIDGHGLPWVTICTADQDGDSPMLDLLLEGLRVPRLGPGTPRT